MYQPQRGSALALLVAIAASVALDAGCSGGGPTRARDVAGDRRPAASSSGAGGLASVPEPPAPTDVAAVKGERARPLVKASARALTLDANRIYYGDSDDDGIYSIAKAGGDALR